MLPITNSSLRARKRSVSIMAKTNGKGVSEVGLNLVSAVLTDPSLYPVQLPGKNKVSSDGLAKIALKRLRLNEGVDFTMQKHQSGSWILVGRPGAAQDVFEYLLGLEPSQYSIKRIQFTCQAFGQDWHEEVLGAYDWLSANKPKLNVKDLTQEGIGTYEFGGDSSQLHIKAIDGVGHRGRDKGITIELSLRDAYCDIAVNQLIDNGYQWAVTFMNALATMFDTGHIWLGVLIPTVATPFERDTQSYGTANRTLSITTAKLIFKYYPTYKEAADWLAGMYVRIQEEGAQPLADRMLDALTTSEHDSDLIDSYEAQLEEDARGEPIF